MLSQPQDPTRLIKLNCRFLKRNFCLFHFKGMISYDSISGKQMVFFKLMLCLQWLFLTCITNFFFHTAPLGWIYIDSDFTVEDLTQGSIFLNQVLLVEQWAHQNAFFLSPAKCEEGNDVCQFHMPSTDAPLAVSCIKSKLHHLRCFNKAQLQDTIRNQTLK